MACSKEDKIYLALYSCWKDALDTTFMIDDNLQKVQAIRRNVMLWVCFLSGTAG